MWIILLVIKYPLGYLLLCFTKVKPLDIRFIFLSNKGIFFVIIKLYFKSLSGIIHKYIYNQKHVIDSPDVVDVANNINTYYL